MAKNEKPIAQPKILQKLILRTALLLFTLAILFGGYRYLEQRGGDFDYGDSNSVGKISAIQYTGDGAKLVLIKPDGSIAGTSSWKDQNTDSDSVWRPDGRFIYFSSDRLDQSYHIFRWNPASGDATDITPDKRSRRNPTFPADNVSDLDQTDDLLMICGGTVQAINELKKTTPQFLPPSSPNITQSSEEPAGGSENQFQSLYGGLGTSFRYARWCMNKRFIAAIMPRDDGGEALILQDVTPKDGKMAAPIPVAAGDHIDFDVNPNDGSVVYSVENFRFPAGTPPQFIKNNHVTMPFRHVVGIVNPDKGAQGPIALSPDDKVAFQSPSVSPDGSRVVVVVGSYDKGTQSMDAKQLVTMPCQPMGGQAGSPLVMGPVREPSWSPDGNTVLFSMGPSGHRDIYTITKEGSDQKNLTNGKGNFGHPLFSPQKSPAQKAP